MSQEKEAGDDTALTHNKYSHSVHRQHWGQRSKKTAILSLGMSLIICIRKLSAAWVDALCSYLFLSAGKPVAQEPTTKHIPSGRLAPRIWRTIGLQWPCHRADISIRSVASFSPCHLVKRMNSDKRAEIPGKQSGKCPSRGLH